MQAHLAQYFPLGMADVEHRWPPQPTLAGVGGMLQILRRLFGRTGVALCHQP